MPLSRRTILAGGLALPLVEVASAAAPHGRFHALERASGGRLGICVLDTGTGRHFGHRLDERFAMCSTFKLPLAAWAMHLAETGALDLSDVLALNERDRVPHAPVTGPHIGKGGLSVAALIEAAQKTSDNVAANVVLRRLGGPAAFTSWLRSLGDATTRLDRYEPDLNDVRGDDRRDTTTPRAFSRMIARIVTGRVLAPAARQMLVRWMVETRTGLGRLRAGLPPDWIAGDKTGTAYYEGVAPKLNDVAVAWPPGRPPLVICCFFEGPVDGSKKSSELEETIAQAGEFAAEQSQSGANHHEWAA